MSATHRVDARGIVADTTLSDRTDIVPYQAGRHRPACWQDGDRVFCVSVKAPASGGWGAYCDQTIAKRAGTTLWVRTAGMEVDDE